MRRVHRWVLFVIFVMVLIVGALSSLAVTTVRSSYPQTSGELSIPGLTASVRVVRNSYGVADIYASNADDLFEAQGYVHAQDRFWEMDFRRHITSGDLSELFGPSQLPTDETIRTMGWYRVAQQEVAELSPTDRGYLDAYSDGVNAYLHSHKTSAISLEYNVLGLTGLNYQPADWTDADSVAWLKAMAWDLSANKDQEIQRALLTPKYGAAEVAELFPDYNDGQEQPIVQQGSVKGGSFDPAATSTSARPDPLTNNELRGASGALQQTAKQLDTIPELVGDGGADLGVGSNSWAVSGSRTTTGKAMLSNDPHLATSIPSIFEQMGLHCTTISDQCPFDVSGYTFSGMPGVIIGHNDQISWGLTTSYVDVEDLYLEQVRGNQVRVGNTWQPLTVRTEEIKVKGQAPHKITIRESRHGPLMSDVDDQYADVGKTAGKSKGTSYAVALAWTALTPGHSMEAVFALDQATNFQQFRDAGKLLDAPSQNLLYADKSGNIGYQLPGAIPIRKQGDDGSMPVPGWDTSYDWHGMINYDQLPYSYNPPDGYIVAANQPIIGKGYPYPLSDGESYGWRSQELINDITSAGKISPAKAESFFYDENVDYAKELLPYLLKVKISDPWVAQGQQVLRNWNGQADADSAGAAFFYVVMRDLLQKTFDDQLPASLQPSSGDTWYAVLANLMKKPNDPWWDDVKTKGVKETRDDIISSAIYQARKDITVLRSEDPSGWSWGALHKITLKHQAFGDVSPINRLFNRGDYPAPGGPAVVDALSFDDMDSFAVDNGPTMRMLINWADIDDSRWINQSGNSGHAYAKNYDDQLPLWATNKTLPFRFTKAAVAANAAETLILKPGT